MKRVLAFMGPWWTAALAVSIGLSSYSCGDSVSVSNAPQVPLSSLAVTPGTLQPAFSSNISTYTVDAPTAATSVTVTAAPTDSTTTMTINGVSTAAGQGRSVPLGPPGSTATITIALSSQTGGEGAYTVTVTRLLSSDNNLSALSVTSGSLDPSFAPNKLTYTVDVATDVTTVTVSATKSDPDAVISGSMTAAAGVPTGQATIALDGPGTSKMLSLTVTAPNGSSKTYSITIQRAASGNNDLSALKVEPGTLTPRFAAGTRNYTVDVGTKVTSVTVSATKADPNAVISGDVPNEGQATIQLGGPGTTTQVEVTVTAQNGNSKTYRIDIERAAPSSDNNLSALTVTPGTLIPDFVRSTTAYTVEVATDVTEVAVAAAKSDPDAVMSGSVTAGTGTPRGEATLPLGAPGTTTQASITMTAPNGSSKTYSLTIHRAASSNNKLSRLTVSVGSLTPSFAPTTLNYTVNVNGFTPSMTISATKQDPNAVMSASGSVIAPSGVPTGQVTVPLQGASIDVPITVIAQDGSPQIYRITVNRSF
jgi:hypothetical protein